MQPGYQQMTGSTVLPGTTAPPPVIPTGAASDDVGYTPPADAPADDGIVFPITNASTLIIDKRWITGTPPNAPPFVANAVLPITNKLIEPFGTGVVVETTVLIPVPNGWTPVTFSVGVSGGLLPPPQPTTQSVSASGNIISITEPSFAQVGNYIPQNLPAPQAPIPTGTTFMPGGSGTVTYIAWYPVTQFWLELKNLNRPFGTQYDVVTTMLGMPEMANLQ
jgi:hypothetical protein